MKIFVVGGATDYASWMEGELVDSIEKADLVVFTGGTDVDPKLYGEPRNPMTQRSDKARDAEEQLAFLLSMKLGKHLIGICRGAQFLCVVAGGKLVQHQDNIGTHKIQPLHQQYGLDRKFVAAADHHQAQYPWGLKVGEDWKLLGFTQNLCTFHQGGSGEEMVNGVIPGYVEVEDAYYPKIKALAIQAHPEWMGVHEPAVVHYRMLLKAHMEDKL